MLETRIYSVLIVSAGEKFNHSLSAFLPESRFRVAATAKSVASARRFLLEKSFDIIIIHAPLPDDFGLRLAMDICAKSNAGVLFLAKNDCFDAILEKAQSAGVFALPRPVSSQAISLSLRLLCTLRERMRNMEQKTASIEEKMEEIRLVNRAKLLLMEHARMTEADAHHFLEKQAMDRRISRRELAESILRTYQ